MNSSHLWIPIALYAVAWLAEFHNQWGRTGRAWPGTQGVLITGWVAHTFLAGGMLYTDGATLEGLLAAAAWLALVCNYAVSYFVVGKSGRMRPLTLMLLPLAIALLLSAILTTEERLGLPVRAGSPWLWRNLLIAHIVALFAGHLLFATACLSSVGYLLQERRLKTKARPLTGGWLQFGNPARWPSLGALENLTHRSVSVGFLLLTIGILLGIAVTGGSHLAEKLTEWRLIIPLMSWVVYAGFLLAYDYRGRRGRFSARWSIAGFLVILASLAFELTVLSAGGR